MGLTHCVAGAGPGGVGRSDAGRREDVGVREIWMVATLRDGERQCDVIMQIESRQRIPYRRTRPLSQVSQNLADNGEICRLDTGP